MLHCPEAGLNRRSAAPSKPSLPGQSGQKASTLPTPLRIGRQYPVASNRSQSSEPVRREVRRSLTMRQEPNRKSKSRAPARPGETAINALPARMCDGFRRSASRPALMGIVRRHPGTIDPDTSVARAPRASLGGTISGDPRRWERVMPSSGYGATSSGMSSPQERNRPHCASAVAVGPSGLSLIDREGPEVPVMRGS
jgi:hypothetical protein